MKIEKIKSLKFNDYIEEFLIAMNESDEDLLQGMMYSLENSKDIDGVLKFNNDLRGDHKRYVRKLSNGTEFIDIFESFNNRIQFSVVEYDQEGKPYAATTLNMDKKTGKGSLKCGDNFYAFEYKDHMFVNFEKVEKKAKIENEKTR